VKPQPSRVLRTRAVAVLAASVPFNLTLQRWQGAWSPIELPEKYTLEPGQVLDVGSLRSEPAIQVSVRVIDKEGHPVEGAKIGVKYDSASFSIGQKRSDPEGRSAFDLNAHAEGSITVFRDDDHIDDASSIRFNTETLEDHNSDIVIILDE
jgi:hypothetical protein